MQPDEQRLHFRDTMASLSAAVNITATKDDAGRYRITAAAICSVTGTPPSLIVYVNANSTMNPVFQGNGELCVNVPSHKQELIVRHFTGMTGMAMGERFSLSCWQKGPLVQSVLKGSLASLKGEIRNMQAIGTHLVYLMEVKNIILSAEGHGLIYFKRRFHPVILEMEAAIQTPAPSRICRRNIFIMISITYPPDE